MLNNISIKYLTMIVFLIFGFTLSLSSVSANPGNGDLLPLSQEGWSLHYVDSQHTQNEDGRGVNAFDGNPNTYWHSKHSPADELPHEIQINLGGIHELEGFSYLPRQINNANGTVNEFEFYVSVDGVEWGEVVASGSFENNLDEKVIKFDEPIIGKYVRFVALSEIKGQQFTTVAELNVFQSAKNEANDKMLVVGETEVSIAAGETKQLKVNWSFDGNEIDVSEIVKYTSLNSEVATVSSKGLITGRGIGETKLRIEDGNSESVEINVTVTEGDPTNEFFIKEEGDLLTIQNWYMAKVFNIADSKVKPDTINNRRSGEIAEVVSGEEFVLHLEGNEVINASDLTLDSWEDVSDESDKKIIQFNFNEQDGVTVTMFVELNEEDHFMRKYLIIDSNNPDLVITDIDLEHLNIPGTSWSSPQSGLQGSGQPVYVNDLFFGVEFPGAQNKMQDSNVVSSYALGYPKVGKNTIETKSAVLGVAPRTEEIRIGFMDYVKTIALEPRFQLQYNPWFELYHDADSDSLIQTYKDVEKGMSSYGVRPFDVYAADDGWMDYRKGFWDFNDITFPNEFKDVKNTLKHFNSKFGVWLGPTGGYKEPGAFAEHLNREYGYPIVNGRVDAADPGYTTALKERMMNLTEEYDVNYWKLDGFLFGGFSQDYITRFFDIWIDTYGELRAHEEDIYLNMTTGSNNSPWLLPYVNSIWLNIGTDAGYVGTGSDRDQMLTYVDDKYYDRFQVMQSQMPLNAIYNHEPIHGIHVKNPAGRDYTQTDEEWRRYLFMSLLRGTGFIEVYYSPSLFDDAQWAINADALTWAEDNFDALSNVEMIGGNPRAGEVYGYSGWSEDKGIVGFRNPSDEVKEYEVTLDSLIGMNDKEQAYYRKTIYPYGDLEEGTFKYGDTITITLQPHEAYIWQFESSPDGDAPIVKSVKSESESHVKVLFNERIEKSSAENIDNYTLNNGGTVNAIELGEDYQSVILQVSSLEKGVNYEITVKNVKDMAENMNETTNVNFMRNDNGLVAHWDFIEEIDGTKATDVTGNTNDATLHEVKDGVFNGTSYVDAGTSPALTGNEDIALSANIRTTKNDEQTIIHQIDSADEIQLELKVNAEGYVEWTTDINGSGFKAISEVKVNDGESHHIVAVRELNGLGKIYIDNELVGSNYKESAQRKGIKADLEKGTIIVGKEFEGIINDIQIFNSSIPYDEIDVLGSETPDNPQPFTETIYQSDWKVHHVSSEETLGEGATGVAKDAFDGKGNTFWHSQYRPELETYPHELQIDLSNINEMKGFRYLPRQVMNGSDFANGIIKDYEFYVSMDGENWGDPVASGSFAADNTEKEVLFDEEQIGRYVRIVALSEIYGQDYAHIAELNVLQTDENVLEKEMQVDETELLMKPEEDKQLKVNFLLDGITKADLTDFVEYTSSDEDIVTVNSNGVITALAEGTAKVTVQHDNLDSIEITINVEKEDGNPTPEVEKGALTKAVTEAEGKVEADYTTESWTALESALDTAQVVLKDADATQEEVNEALESLTSAINGLVAADEGGDPTPEVEKDALTAAVIEAEGKVEADYTTESWTALESALDTAQVVLKDADATQEEVNEALESLTSAINGLVAVDEDGDPTPEVEKAALTTAVTEAEGKVEADYTTESWIALESALDTAQSVLKATDATQEEVNEALESLTNAIKGLVAVDEGGDPTLEVEKDALTAAVTEAEGKVEADYTAESWIALESALGNAQSVLKDVDATQAEINEAFEALNNAIKGLTVVEEEEPTPEPETGDENNDDESTEDNVIIDDEKTPTDKDDGSYLPKTATNIMNIMLIGLLLLVIGFTAWYINYRRKETR